MVVSPAALEAVIAAREGHDRFPPSFLAGAVADLMADGFLADHTRRMRRRDRAARDAVVSALADAAGKTLDFASPQQGLHLLVLLPKGLPSHAAADIRAQAAVEGLLLLETRLKAADRDGFILGFSGYDTAELTAAATGLGQATKRHLAGFRRVAFVACKPSVSVSAG